jgi:hypothetical protein
MSFIRRLRSYFFSTSADTPINGFYTRFIDGSKPNQNTFEELTASAAFHAEADSAAQTDSVGALINKQGLVILSEDASAKANSDVVLGGTAGVKVPQNRHLPTVIDSVTDQVLRDFTGKPLQVAVDATGSNNKYSFNFRTAFLTMLSKFLLPSFTTGDSLKVVRVNAGETAYELATVAAGTGGASYSGVSVTSNSIANGTKTFAITPDAGTFKVAIGNRIRFTDDADSANYVEGIVSAASPTSITIDADNFGGTGTIADWTYNLGGNIPSADVTGVANLFVSQLEGDDTTGTGSINKPFATLAKAQSLVTDNQTIVMFGGNYTNSINIVKDNTTYTIFCFPGVTITQSSTSFYDSLAVAGRVDIVGKPNVICTSLLAGTDICFIVHEIAYLELGKITGAYQLFEIYSRGNNLGEISSVQSNENTFVSVEGASWNSTSVPAVKFSKAVGSSAYGNGTIFCDLKSLEYTPNLSSSGANYVEIVDPYTLALTGNFQYRGSGTLTSPDFIKVTSTSFTEVAINRLTCRLGGANVVTPNIINLGANNISSSKFYAKDVNVSLRSATFVTASTASSFYAEDIVLPTGSTIQGGSATIKTIAPAHANTRTYIAGDNNLATLFNI